MPPKSPLPKEIIEDFVTWIENGAPDPRLIANSDEQRLAQARSHWSFMPITNPTPPQTRNSWVQNDIDRFVFRRLKSESIRPSKDADPRTLIRRLYLDLIGLPPLPAEVMRLLLIRQKWPIRMLLQSCWNPNIMGNVGEDTGSTWLATRTAMVMNQIVLARTRGDGETGSSIH